MALCPASVVHRQQFLQMTSSPKPLGQCQNHLTQMFLLCPFTKIAKMIPLHWTRWPPELKIEKIFKWQLHLGPWPDFKTISQKCSSYGPLPKLVKWFHSAGQMPFTKIAKMVLLDWTKWLPGLEKKLLIISSPWPVVWFQNNFTEMFLLWSCTTIAKMVLLGWIKW